MRALAAARTVGAPDWLIAAGAVRTAVWDRLHGFAPPPAAGAASPAATGAASPAAAGPRAIAPRPPASLADIDLIFFDPADLSSARDAAVEAALRTAAPDLPWQAKNQAAVHLWYAHKFGYAVEPLQSSADGVATWPETATAVALRLTEGDGLIVCAPFGLDDLLGLVHRRNPRRVSVEEYERRLRSKRISERWPHVRVVPARERLLPAIAGSERARQRRIRSVLDG
jgi:hypothetical protein